jgi:hypothetical protein
VQVEAGREEVRGADVPAVVSKGPSSASSGALWRFAVATRVFTDAELDRLRSFPEINPDELIRFFTPTKSGCP